MNIRDEDCNRARPRPECFRGSSRGFPPAAESERKEPLRAKLPAALRSGAAGPEILRQDWRSMSADAYDSVSRFVGAISCHNGE